MNKLYVIGAIVFVISAFILSGCGGHKGLINPIRTGASSNQTTAGTPATATAGYTEEDIMLLQMPYQERMDYLNARFKELVFQFHGIVLDDSMFANRATSDASISSGHAVCVADDVRDPLNGKEAWFNEKLIVSEDVEGERWSLSFLERLNGDLNFDGVVGIADLTPIAQNFGAFYDESTNPPRWDLNTYPAAPDVDRVSSADLKIGVEDITSIGMNFGMATRGYNIYYFDQDDDVADSVLIAEDCRTAINPALVKEGPAAGEHRNGWSGDFLKSQIPGVAQTDIENWLYVRLVYYSPTECAEDNPSCWLEWDGTPPQEDVDPNPGDGIPPQWALANFQVNYGQNPTADIVSSHTQLPKDSLFTFDGAGSTPFPSHTIVKYSFDFGDGTPKAEIVPPATSVQHSFSTSGEKTITLTVTQENDKKGSDEITVTVLGDPEVKMFKPTVELADYWEPGTPITGEVIADVTWDIHVKDPNLGGIRSIEIDCKGVDFSDNWVTIYSDPNGQSNDVSDDYLMTFTRADIVDANSDACQQMEFDSRLRVIAGTGEEERETIISLTSGGSLDIGPTFKLRRAKPVLSLTTTPEADVFTSRYDDEYGNPQVANYRIIGVAAGGEVTFDARESIDRDGEELDEALVPTEYVFDFGDGSNPVTHDYDSPPQGYGLQVHQYTTPGKYTATISARDDDYDRNSIVLGDVTELQQHSLHEDVEQVVIYVYSSLANAPLDSEWVDAGIRNEGHWTDLGNPSIALDISVLYDDTEEAFEYKLKGTPGVVYYTGDQGVTRTLDSQTWRSPLFTERVNGAWAVPNKVRTGTDTHFVGEQCDLMYDVNHVPWIAATWRLPPQPGGVQRPDRGISIYSRSGTSWGKTDLVGGDLSNLVDIATPIRLMAGPSASVVHYKSWGSNGYTPWVNGLYEVLWEPANTSYPILFFKIQASSVLYSHDTKPWMNVVDFGTRTGVVHVTDRLGYEWRIDAGTGWNGDLVQVSGNPALVASRDCALDYYVPDVEEHDYHKLGVCWISSTGALMFAEYVYEDQSHSGNWTITTSTSSPIDTGAGYYCDFDYLPGGFPAVAYEKLPTAENLPSSLWAAVKLGGSWALREIDGSVGVGIHTHLDMDVFDGYQYILYSKLKVEVPPIQNSVDIRCAIIDFFDRP